MVVMWRSVREEGGSRRSRGRVLGCVVVVGGADRFRAPGRLLRRAGVGVPKDSAATKEVDGVRRSENEAGKAGSGSASCQAV